MNTTDKTTDRIRSVDLIDDGILWLINRTTFHPRGFALAYDPEQGTFALVGRRERAVVLRSSLRRRQVYFCPSSADTKFASGKPMTWGLYFTWVIAYILGMFSMLFILVVVVAIGYGSDEKDSE